MMIVVAIVGMIAGLMYPSISSSLDGIRLNTSSEEVVAFLNGALERANRRNTPVEITMLKAENALRLRSTEPGFERRLDLADGILLERIFPEIAVDSMVPRVFLIYPGGTVPRIGVQIATPRGRRRIIRIDPITGTPQIERLPSDPS
jgi:hypothetical protein